jgi:hypothetical protein
MRKKLLSVLIAVTLVASVFTPLGAQRAEAAAGTTFIFDNLGASANSPMKTNDKKITIIGSYNKVSEGTIFYTVEQILDKNSNPMRVGLRTNNSTSGLAAANGVIAVTNLELFPGLNRITFKGQAGFQELTDVFYVEYIDNPVIYDLELMGNVGNFPVNDSKLVVTEGMTAQPGTGNITLHGFAPNAQQIFVYINDNFNKSFAVVNNEFFATGLTLRRGKNTVRLVVSNEDQTVETTKEFIYFNGDVTFFDVQFGANTTGDTGSDAILEPEEIHDPTLNPTIPGGAGDELLISGKLVVPNYYALKPTAPKILSAVFQDRDASGAWSTGDTLTITFDVDTNMAGDLDVSTATGVNQLINWDADGAGAVLDLGTQYSGSWSDARTLVITANDVTGNNLSAAMLASAERIGILSSGNLRTADDRSDSTTDQVQLTGTLNGIGSIPYIVSAIAADGSNSPGLAADDYIEIVFSADTNMAGYAVGQPFNKAAVDDIFLFSHSLGANYSGVWSNPRTLRIVVEDASGGNFNPRTSTLQLTAPATSILSSDESAYAELRGNAYVVTGTFGETSNTVYSPSPNIGSTSPADNIIIEVIGQGNGDRVIEHDKLQYSDDYYPVAGTPPQVVAPPSSSEYFVLEFNNVNIGAIHNTTEDLAAGQFIFDQLYSLTFVVRNYVKSAANNNVTMDRQSGYSFTLRDESLPYIRGIRYLTNYDAVAQANQNYSRLTGIQLGAAGYEIFESPFELEIASNQDLSGIDVNNYPNHIKIEAYDSNGVKIPGDVEFKVVTVADTPANNKIIQITKLPRVGYQVLRIHLELGSTGPAYDQPITYIFGPYVTFAQLYNGIIAEQPDDRTTDEIGVDALDFTAFLHNVEYGTIIVSGTPTVTMTLNGTPLELAHDGKGKLTVTNPAAARGLLNPGRNTLVFTYQYLSEYYTRTIIINVLPTDQPEVPAEGSAGIYPSTLSNYRKDPDRFTELSTGMFSTKEKSFNVYGSFRLLTLDSNIASHLQRIEENQYRFEIMRNGETIIRWDLKNNHFRTENGSHYNNSQPNQRIPNFDVIYDRSTGYFTFQLSNQTVPDNTGSMVYTFIAYKETSNTFYRMEIQTIDTPYTILRPFLPEQYIVNQNYLDVVIHSEGAESITANKKFVGEKIDFDEDNDGDVDFPGAFRIRVKDLKADKENEIKFTITLGTGETIDGSFKVYYATTNIPGAQHLQAMGSKINAFDGALELTFPRGTVLKNKVDPTNRNAVQRTYANHDILLGIAAPHNGVVDRRIYEDLPSGFANKIAMSELEFNATLPSRFTMISPLFWIDAGLADNPSTAAFDPVQTGILPFQFPQSGLPSYMDRTENRALVPTERGELTLSFDPYLVEWAGTQVSVFRYDPILKMWENIGGKVDTRKNTVTVPFDQFGYYAVMKLQYSFTDITTHPYARDEMDAIYAKGVMLSFNDDSFGANNNIARGEFAAMVVRALQIPLNYDNRNLHFDDVSTVIVPGSLWDYRFIETAAREGILLGVAPRRFEPYTQLTREQAAVILARALELKMEVNRTKVDEELSKQFQDYSTIDYYARPAVVAVMKAGLMKGRPVDANDPKAGMVFEPKDNLLRSDAAIMMSRLMASRKLLPEMN